MTVRAIAEGLGEFIHATFRILEVLGNGPNFLFILIGAVFFIYWMGLMRKHARAGEK